VQGAGCQSLTRHTLPPQISPLYLLLLISALSALRRERRR
jgi:hypothetical protein